jgi:hypothetical protein
MQRRSKALSPAIQPLTPEPPATEPLTYSEIVSQNHYLRHITNAERRRHAAVEKQFVKALNGLQDTLDNVRQLYISTIAPKPERAA